MKQVIVNNNMTRVVVLSHRPFKGKEGASTPMRIILGMGLTRVDSGKWDLVKGLPLVEACVSRGSLVISDVVDATAEADNKMLEDAVRKSVTEANTAKKGLSEQQLRVQNLERRKQTILDNQKAKAEAEAESEELTADEERLLAELEEMEGAAADDSTSSVSPGGDDGSADVV